MIKVGIIGATGYAGSELVKYSSGAYGCGNQVVRIEKLH